jgi:hypothetical protein
VRTPSFAADDSYLHDTPDPIGFAEIARLLLIGEREIGI